MKIVKRYAVYLLAWMAISDSANYWVWKISGSEPHLLSGPHLLPVISIALFIVGILVFNVLLGWHREEEKRSSNK